MKSILLIAKKEFVDHLRNGWIIAISISFTLFAMIISLAGFGFTGNIGNIDEQATLLSLTNLVIYLIPLLGLVLAYDSLSGEREQGTLDLLYSYPISPLHILSGKFFGLVLVLTVSILLGMLIPMLTGLVNGQSFMAWLIFQLFSIWLGVIFVAIALLLSSTLWERGRLLGISIGLWLIFVILFDVAIIGVLVATEGNLSPILVDTIFYLNPTSLFRFLSIQNLYGEELLVQMGMANQIPPAWSMYLVLCLWTVIPMLLSFFKIRKMN
ncbi:MAG: ABC transporter permease [Gammaproteobacteria bacterium]|nr:ABC transporter permease [Gammaproteobacteria bacterium]